MYFQLLTHFFMNTIDLLMIVINTSGCFDCKDVITYFIT